MREQKKIVILVTRKETTKSCGINQLCRGLETVIEGATHHARSLWDQNYNKEED